MAENTILKFHSDGSFKILHMTDLQEGLSPKKDTIRLMNAILDKANPDLVVLTGDQIKGYSLSFRLASKERIERSLNTLLAPIVKRGIPIAVTFGNHDCQCGLSNKEQMYMYQRIPGVIIPIESPSAGTFYLPVLGTDGNEAMRIYVLYSGGNAPKGGYEAPSSKNLTWLRQSLAQHSTSSILFQHIPLPEYKLCQNIQIQEPICSPKTNVGEFDILKESQSVFAVFCGHDHKNDFLGNVDGIDLGYTPSCGFACYGPGAKRGSRLIELKENELPNYQTKLLTYENLIAPHTSNRLKEFWDMHLPTCWPMNQGE